MLDLATAAILLALAAAGAWIGALVDKREHRVDSLQQPWGDVPDISGEEQLKPEDFGKIEHHRLNVTSPT
jgi:hypothetical protein